MRMIPCVFCSLVLLLPHQSAHGNPYGELVRQMAAQSFQGWQATNAGAGRPQGGLRVQANGLGGTKAVAEAHEKARQEYLAKLAPAMKLPPEIAHIPEEQPVEVNDEKRWAPHYLAAKGRLRPRTAYRWSTNATSSRGLVTLSEEHVAAWRANFDFVIWYRDQLGQQATSNEHAGAHCFQLFLDHIVAGLLETLPETPGIDMNRGAVSAPEWRIDERRLREQLVMAQRYLRAKYQIYQEYEEFAPADVALLASLFRMAFLMGAQFNPAWFDEMKIDLTAVTATSQWKAPMTEALRLLKAAADRGLAISQETEAAAAVDSGPCIITIPPPKPKKKADEAPSAEKKAPDVQQIEIIVRPKA